ncbi:MAG: Spherulation-specific family 4 [Pseudomonadota bacterium]|jgi:hypothetical protein
MQRVHWRKNTTTFACAALLLACSSDPVAGAKREDGVGTHARAVSPDEEGEEFESEDSSDDGAGDNDDSDESGDDGDTTDGDDGDTTDGDDGDNTDGDDGDNTDGDDTDGDDGDKTDGDKTDGDDDNTEGDDGDKTDGDKTDGDKTEGDDGVQTPLPEGEGPLENPDRTVAGVDGTDGTGAAVNWKILAEIKGKTQGASVLKAAYVDGVLHVRIEGQGLGSNYHVYVDADGNAETGIQLGPWEATGIDLVVEGENVYAADPSTGWVDDKKKETVTKNVAANFIELTIPGTLPGLPIAPTFGLGYLERDAGGTALPQYDFARPAPSWSHTGVVIPAYLGVGNEGWGLLKNQASKVSGAGKDFWVAVNGPDSGPFGLTKTGDKAPEDAIETLKKLTPRWEDIQKAGGKIFGYVHTCTTDPCSVYRPLANVEAEVRQWLLDFPTLDGIWIDEFYPQFDGQSAPAGKQVDPTNSWHAKLTATIASARAAGTGRGKLLTIGNAGGRLISNRLLYANLVDVLCTFEKAHNVIEPVPAQGSAVANPGILRQNVAPRRGQLALVHNVQSVTQMQETVKRIVKEGYSHLFVTDGIFVQPGVPNLNPLWANVPTYLPTEATSFLSPQ